MKKVLLVLFVAFIGTVSLNAQKLGHINLSELVESMPAKQQAEASLQKESDAKGADIKKSQDALQAKFDAFQKKVGGLTADQQQAQAQALQTEYQGLQAEAQKLDELRQKAVQELAKKEQDLIQPIQDQVMKAVDAVANSKGLEYVFDTSSGAFLVAKGVDIMADVRKQLGF